MILAIFGLLGNERLKDTLCSSSSRAILKHLANTLWAKDDGANDRTAGRSAVKSNMTALLLSSSSSPAQDVLLTAVCAQSKTESGAKVNSVDKSCAIEDGKRSGAGLYALVARKI